MKSKLLLTCTALLFCTCFLHGQSQASKVVNSGENSHSGWVQHPWQGKKVGYIGDSITDPNCNHTIFRHDNFIGCLSADKIKMPVRKYFCFNIPVYRNMAEAPSCRSPYHEEYIQTSVSGSPEGLCHLTYNSLSKRR